MKLSGDKCSGALRRERWPCMRGTVHHVSQVCDEAVARDDTKWLGDNVEYLSKDLILCSYLNTA